MWSSSSVKVQTTFTCCIYWSRFNKGVCYSTQGHFDTCPLDLWCINTLTYISCDDLTTFHDSKPQPCDSTHARALLLVSHTHTHQCVERTRPPQGGVKHPHRVYGGLSPVTARSSLLVLSVVDASCSGEDRAQARGQGGSADHQPHSCYTIVLSGDLHMNAFHYLLLHMKWYTNMCLPFYMHACMYVHETCSVELSNDREAFLLTLHT